MVIEPDAPGWSATCNFAAFPETTTPTILSPNPALASA
jgi:hypothetical protein